MINSFFMYSCAIAAAAYLLVLSSNISAQNPLRLCTDDLDSTYPNFDGGAAGVFPAAGITSASSSSSTRQLLVPSDPLF